MNNTNCKLVYKKIGCEKEKNNEIIYKKNYQVCTNCIMDTTDPTINFDENGVCDYCNNFNENIVPNWHVNKRGEQELMRVAARIKNEDKGKDFDCIIGMSGGLDMLVRVFGLLSILLRNVSFGR